MQVDADVKQQAEPMFTQETHEGHGHQIIFFENHLSTWLSWFELGSTATATKLKEACVLWYIWLPLMILPQEAWASLRIVLFSAGRNASDASSRRWEGWWCIHSHTHTYNYIYIYYTRDLFSIENGKVRAVASVHRQAEKDPALIFCWSKFICTCSFLQEQRPLLPVGVKLDQSLEDQVKSMALNMPVDGDLVVQQDKAHGSFFLLVANQSHEFP